MSTPSESVPEPIELFGTEMLADPYPVYRRLRETDPVHWHVPFGAWVLTRYDDVVAAFHDPRLSSERAEPLRALAGRPDLDPFFDYLADRMDFKDPPAHARLRGLVNKAFTLHAVTAMTDRIQALVDQLLDRVQAQGGMDVIRDLAFPVPGIVIAELLGAPAGDYQQLKHWSDAFVGFFKTVPSETTAADYQRSWQAADALGVYYRNILTGHGAGNGGGLLKALEQAEVAGDRFHGQELSANATLLLHAGHETTTHLIGNGLYALLRHPEQWERLRKDPTLVPAAVEEMLRYDSPVQFTYRSAAEDFDWHGRPIRAGQVVHMVLAAANRDPEHFPEPDRLDIERTPNKHMTFGHGHHFCLGAPLARLEGEIIFRTLLRRFPNLRLAEAPPVRQPNFVLRGFSMLPVLF
jgi:cytochrome P450